MHRFRRLFRFQCLTRVCSRASLLLLSYFIRFVVHSLFLFLYVASYFFILYHTIFHSEVEINTSINCGTQFDGQTVTIREYQWICRWKAVWRTRKEKRRKKNCIINYVVAWKAARRGSRTNVLEQPKGEKNMKALKMNSWMPFKWDSRKGVNYNRDWKVDEMNER